MLDKGGAYALIAATGQWEKATVTVYLCAISVVFACLIGVPIAVWASTRERAWKGVEVFVDTLQTLPSFVYLMPVVMLFRVGDFTAIVAVVAYSLAPVIRYTGHGLRSVDPQLIEAGVVSGCTPFQILTKIRLKLALPELMLGLNQTIMLAISICGSAIGSLRSAKELNGRSRGLSTAKLSSHSTRRALRLKCRAQSPARLRRSGRACLRRRRICPPEPAGSSVSAARPNLH